MVEARRRRNEMYVQGKPATMRLRSLPRCVEEDLRQFARLGEHRPVASVHLHQPPVLAGQQLGYLVAELVSGKQALDVRRREFAQWPGQHGGLGERGAGCGVEPPMIRAICSSVRP